MFAVVPQVTFAASWCDAPVVSGMCMIVTKVIFIPLYLSAFLIALAGLLLDFVIQYTVVDIAAHLKGITGISIAWSVIRDLINISFIFLLLYAAVMTILGEGTGLIKKTITGVVMAAILVNFSLFFTRVVIDTSNLVALTFHESIVTSPYCTGSGTRGKLSECFVQPLGLSTIFGDDSNGQTLLDGLNGEFAKAAVISVGGTIFILIATFIFLAAAVMFLVRFVSLVFLLIFSPVGIVGMFLPQLSSQSKKWVSDLTEHLMFPPVFMILVWVVLSVISSPGFITSPALSGNKLSGLFQNSLAVAAGGAATGTGPGPIELVFNFFIIISMLIGTLTISKGFSKKGGEMGGKFAGAVLGGGLARQTIGRGANRLANNEKLKEAASQSGFKGASARLALRGAQGSSKASFDMRGTKVGGYFGKQLGAGSAGGKGGFEKSAKEKEKEIVEKNKKIAESYKVSDLEKARVDANLTKAKANLNTIENAAKKERDVAQDAVEEKKIVTKSQAESLVAQKSQLQIDAENNLAQWKLGANAPGLDPTKKKEIDDNIAKYSAEIDSHKKAREVEVDKKAKELFDRDGAAEQAALKAAEDKLENIQQGVSTERSELIKAQIESDKLKGINAEEVKARIKKAQTILDKNKEEDTKQIDNDLAKNIIDQAEANRRKAEVERTVRNGDRMRDARAKLLQQEGLAIPEDEQAVSSLDTQRQIAHADRLVNPAIISTGRVAFVGKVRRENLSAALAIRKATKDKTDEQKLADAAKAIAKKQVEQDEKDKKTDSPAPAAPSGGAPAGGAKP
jgi:hypothetical protein